MSQARTPSLTFVNSFVVWRVWCSQETEAGRAVGRTVAFNGGVKAAHPTTGSNLTMTWEGAGLTVGIVQGSTFMMNHEGMFFACRM